jgi:DHA1 family multidrug resistance protein-like MFS transporter
MPLYVNSLGIGILGWSVLATSIGLGMFLFEWVWGTLSDSVDRRLLMVAALLSMSVLYPLYTLQGLVPYFVVLQFIYGAIGVIGGPTTRAYVSDDSPPKSIGFFVSLWWAFSAMGSIIGPLLGAYIAQTWSFRYSFYTSTILSVACAVVVLIVLPKNRKTPTRTTSRDMIGGLKLLLRIRPAGLLFFAVAFAFMGRYSLRAFLPLYASEQIGMSTIDIGILLSATSAAQLAALPVLGKLADRFGMKHTVLTGLVLSSLILLFCLLAKTSFQLLLVSIILFVTLSASSLLLAMIPDVAPNTFYGTAVGLYGSFEDLGVIIGPLIFGLIWASFGSVFIFIATAIMQVLGATLVLGIRNHGTGMPRQ